MVVQYVKRFEKELKNTPNEIQRKVLNVITILESSTNLESSGLDYKRMEGQKSGENYYRIRVGEWRIGIECIHPDVTLLRILSRGSIYKSFPPKS